VTIVLQHSPSFLRPIPQTNSQKPKAVAAVAGGRARGACVAPRRSTQCHKLHVLNRPKPGPPVAIARRTPQHHHHPKSTTCSMPLSLASCSLLLPSFLSENIRTIYVLVHLRALQRFRLTVCDAPSLPGAWCGVVNQQCAVRVVTA